jgi:hypothetical protein
MGDSAVESAGSIQVRKGHVLEVKTRPDGSNCLLVAGSKAMAVLRPGTEVAILRIPLLWRWKGGLRHLSLLAGMRAIFQHRKSGTQRRVEFIFADGRMVSLKELPQGLRMTVTSVPADLKSFDDPELIFRRQQFSSATHLDLPATEF